MIDHDATSGTPRQMSKPVHVRRLVLRDDAGRSYVIEHAGAWDPPDDDLDGRSGVYYEDDVLPAGAISLYRVSSVETPPTPQDAA